ncbi:MAG: DUF2911 domain-containing protein [Sediminibacterium sp.]|nr:DUF2911 domain-containing protein [Sediminibacterium sp.]
MKKILFVTIAVITGFFVSNAQVKMPAASPTATISQEFGLGKIEITYSRPSLKGRTVFGEKSTLAPLNEMWRVGANAATKIVFTEPVIIGGKRIDSGSYVIYVIPRNNEWEIIFNKGLKNWGVDGYKESEDVVRIKAPTWIPAKPLETFSISIQDITNETCNLQMSWGYVSAKFEIRTEIMGKLRSQFETALSAEKVNTAVYQSAANFYFDMDKNYPKALENIKKAIENNQKGFWLYLLQGKIYKALGDNANAKLSAEQCKKLAMEAKNADYVRNADDLLKTL